MASEQRSTRQSLTAYLIVVAVMVFGFYRIETTAAKYEELSERRLREVCIQHTANRLTVGDLIRVLEREYIVPEGASPQLQAYIENAAEEQAERLERVSVLVQPPPCHDEYNISDEEVQQFMRNGDFTVTSEHEGEAARSEPDERDEPQSSDTDDAPEPQPPTSAPASPNPDPPSSPASTQPASPPPPAPAEPSAPPERPSEPPPPSQPPPAAPQPPRDSSDRDDEDRGVVETIVEDVVELLPLELLP